MNPLCTKTVIAIAALTFASTALSQQTAIFPSAVGSGQGASEEYRFPWANGVSRTMAVYDSWDLTVPDGANITAIGFRQEPGRASPATGVQLEVYMGPAATTSDSTSSTFANNYLAGTTPTLVFGPGIINLPAATTGGTPQDVMINLTTPYTYDDTQGLVVEFRVLANSNGNAAFTYYVDRSTYISPVSTFGQGCTSSAGQVPSFTFSPSHIGGNLTARLTSAPASSFIYLNLDTVQANPVIPGAPFGAPGCSLYVLPTILLTQQAGSTSGSANFSIPVPQDILYYEMDVYGQCIIGDLFGNSLGFVSSNAAQITIGARGPMSTITRSGSTTSATGSPYQFHGVVTLFEY